jgi:hypothetical protein
MRIAFLTEMGFEGKIPPNHTNMRTEFAWMYALDADHFNIRNLQNVKGYDHVFVIFPKGEVYLNAVGGKLIEKKNPVSDLLSLNLVELLKSQNNKVHYVQEGPHWLWNDYEMVDQINFYNLLANCDSIFAHNEDDVPYYKGLFPNQKINVITTLMIEGKVSTMIPKKEDKVIIGGNFARWYGGFESYIVASRFELPIYAQTSHAKRDGEELMDNLTHLPRLMWDEWMTALKDFKYAVHLMPTVAAGTFSLNCAYFGIPCIGNVEVDTQQICHPRLSVNCNNVEEAAELAAELKNNQEFYESCSREARENYRKHYDIEVWKQKMNDILCR